MTAKTSVYFQIILLALTLFALQSCDPKSPARNLQVDVELPMVKSFDLSLDISSCLNIARNQVLPLRDAEEKTLYEDCLSWDLNEIISSANLSEADIKSIHLDRVTIECVSPEGVKLSDFAPIYLYAGNDFRLVAETRADKSQENLVDLVLHEKELVNYIKAEKLPIRITTTIDKITDWAYDGETIYVKFTFYSTSTVQAK